MYLIYLFSYSFIIFGFRTIPRNDQMILLTMHLGKYSGDHMGIWVSNTVKAIPVVLLLWHYDATSYETISCP